MLLRTFQSLPAPVRHLMFFVLAGGAAFVTDALGLYLLTRAGLHPLLARVASISVAMVVAWFLNRTLTFRVQTAPTMHEFLRYAALAWGVAALNYALYAILLMAKITASPLLATAISSAAAMVASYAGMRLGVFRRPKNAPL